MPDQRYRDTDYRLADLVVALLAFDRRECGENSSFSYVATSGRQGGLTPAGERRPRARVARLLRALDAGAWLFLPFCVFSPDHARCADGAQPRRRPGSEREGWLARARGGDCAGILVGREGQEIVVRPAFNEWRGGDSLIAIADDLGGLDAPLRHYLGTFARR